MCPCTKDAGRRVNTGHEISWSVTYGNTAHTQGGKSLTPCNVAGVGCQTEAAQCSSFPPVLQAINFKATLTESLLFQKTMVWAPVGCSMGSAGTLKRFPQQTSLLGKLCHAFVFLMSQASHQRPHGLITKGGISGVKRVLCWL